MGVDRRYLPTRIVDVLREVDADVIGLQEVLCHSPSDGRDQARLIAGELGMDFRFGKTRHIAGADYGNAILSRFPILKVESHDITVNRYEPRGCMRATLSMGKDLTFQFTNLHMGTSYFERRKQVHKILSVHALEGSGGHAGRIIAGDLNEWTTGVTTRTLKARFSSVDPKLHFGRSRTFPGLFPLFHLDHIYFDATFVLRSADLHRTSTSILASDHLPISADFDIFPDV